MAVKTKKAGSRKTRPKTKKQASKASKSAAGRKAAANKARKAAPSKPLVLVTGAGGFVGRHVVEDALVAGFAVRATDLPGRDLVWAKDMGAEVKLGDLTIRDHAADLVKGVDRVAHIAAAFNLAMSRTDLLKINLNGSVNLAEAAASEGVDLFVNCSTADTYGTSKQIPTRESDAQNPDNDYAFSKLLAEQAVVRVGKRTSMPVTTIRPTVIYGPGAVYTASLFCTLPYIVHKRFGFFPTFTGGPLVNAVHVKDVSGAVVFLLGKPEAANQAYNVADDDWQTMGEYIYNLVDPIGVRFGPFSIPVLTSAMVAATKVLQKAPAGLFEALSALLRAEWEKIRTEHSLRGPLNPRFDKGFLSYGLGDHAYDNTKLKAAGYRFKYPRFAEGYAETIEWYKKNRWIPESATSV